MILLLTILIYSTIFRCQIHRNLSGSAALPPHYHLATFDYPPLNVLSRRPKSLISFQRLEEREHLTPPLPTTWYYLNALDGHTVEVYRVDPKQTFLGNAISPAKIALIDDPLIGKGRVISV